MKAPTDSSAILRRPGARLVVQSIERAFDEPVAPFADGLAIHPQPSDNSSVGAPPAQASALRQRSARACALVEGAPSVRATRVMAGAAQGTAKATYRGRRCTLSETPLPLGRQDPSRRIPRRQVRCGADSSGYRRNPPARADRAARRPGGARNTRWVAPRRRPGNGGVSGHETGPARWGHQPSAGRDRNKRTTAGDCASPGLRHGRDRRPAGLHEYRASAGDDGRVLPDPPRPGRPRARACDREGPAQLSLKSGGKGGDPHQASSLGCAPTARDISLERRSALA